VPSAPRCVGLADLSVMPPEESERTVAPIPIPIKAEVVLIVLQSASRPPCSTAYSMLLPFLIRSLALQASEEGCDYTCASGAFCRPHK